tara:strand:- start:802 stop:1023 length:222 start_codon:yes stop_codon:yes gene_type:complete
MKTDGLKPIIFKPTVELQLMSSMKTIPCQCNKPNCIASLVGAVPLRGFLYECPDEVDNDLAGTFLIPFAEVFE